MSRSTSNLKRGASSIFIAALVATGTMAIATPANAAPASPAPAEGVTAVSAVTPPASVVIGVGDIAPNESVYKGWHEGYPNAVPAYSVATDGLHFGDGAPSQILNGLVDSGKPGIATTDLLALITGANVEVVSGPVTFQVAVTWANGWSTLRSAVMPAGPAGFAEASLWTSSKPLGKIAAGTPVALSALATQIRTLGDVRYSGFGVQADTSAVVSSITWGATSYSFAVEPTRIAGADRFDTAVKISKTFAPGVSRVYVANGLNYPDALSAAPAAAHFGGPLLLTAQDQLPTAVIAELGRLNPGTIVLVGGPSAVSAKVATELGKIADVTRISGADRYETSRQIAQDAFGVDGATIAYIATGNNFPDALSASPAAAHLNGPVVLVPGWQGRLTPRRRACSLR